MDVAEAEQRGVLIRAGWNASGEEWTHAAHAHGPLTFERAMAYYASALDGQQLARHLRVGDVLVQEGIWALTVVQVTRVNALGFTLVEASANGRVFSRVFPADQMLRIERPAC